VGEGEKYQGREGWMTRKILGTWKLNVGKNAKDGTEW
jgi:hypothetical protein